MYSVPSTQVGYLTGRLYQPVTYEHVNSPEVIGGMHARLMYDWLGSGGETALLHYISKDRAHVRCAECFDISINDGLREFKRHR